MFLCLTNSSFARASWLALEDCKQEQAQLLLSRCFLVSDLEQGYLQMPKKRAVSN